MTSLLVAPLLALGHTPHSTSSMDRISFRYSLRFLGIWYIILVLQSAVLFLATAEMPPENFLKGQKIKISYRFYPITWYPSHWIEENRKLWKTSWESILCQLLIQLIQFTFRFWGSLIDCVSHNSKKMII